MDGVFTFTNGIVSTAKTCDITKHVGGTAGLVTKTVGGLGDGVSSVLFALIGLYIIIAHELVI